MVQTFGNDLSASRACIDLDVPEFTAILPYTEELQLHPVGESMTNNLKWGLYVQPGFDRDRELGGGLGRRAVIPPAPPVDGAGMRWPYAGSGRAAERARGGTPHSPPTAARSGAGR